MKTKIKRLTATILCLLLLLQSASFCPVIANATTATSVTVANILNKEGLWLTEIYTYDEDRSTQRASVYESIDTFSSSENLMEFIEVSSTHNAEFDLNETYSVNYGDTALVITDMADKTDISIQQGQSVVIWNYRSDLGITLPTENQFRNAMNIPDDAVILKTEIGENWADSTAAFSIVSKTENKTVSSYTVSSSVVAKGFSVELKVPFMGDEMEVYRKFSIPSPGSFDTAQLNGLVYGKDSTKIPQGAYISEIRAYGDVASHMEYIEIYNTTDTPIDLNSDYCVKYWRRETYRERITVYSDNTMTNTNGCTIPAGGTAILWCYNLAVTQLDMPEGVPVYYFTINSYDKQLPNGQRGLETYKINEDGSETLISSFGYLSADASNSVDNAIHLKPNHERAQLIWVSGYLTAPGELKSTQTTFDDDGSKLTATPDDNDTDYSNDVIVPASVMQGEELRVLFRCVAKTSGGKEGALTRTKGEMYYLFKTNGVWADSWTLKEEVTNTGTVYLRDPDYFEAIIPANKLYDVEAVQFYIKVDNKYRCTTSNVYQVQVNKLSQVDGIKTNINSGDYVKGNISVAGNDGNGNSNLSLKIDNTTYSNSQLSPMLDNGAYLTFNMTGRSKSGMHALTTTDNTLMKMLSYWYDIVQDGQAIKIDNSLFTYNSTTKAFDTTIRFWAGTSGTYIFDSVFIDNTDTKYYNNIDPYTVENLTLRFNDNSYTPTKIINRKGAVVEANANGNYNIGTDSSGTRNSAYARIDVSFSIPEADVTAKGISTTLSDGTHTATFTSGTQSKTINFIVDNTAPVINTGIIESETLSGNILINPTITENNPESSKILLDGREISVPFNTTAYDLGRGEHTLEVLATDKAGNTTTATTTFNVNYSDITVQNGIATDITDKSAKLSVTLNTSVDDTDVTFYKAHKIDSIETLSVTDSDVPYLKYTVDVGNVETTDEIAINWQGTALNNEGYATKMYVLNTNATVEPARWDLIAEADSDGTIDKATFTAENHVDSNGKAIIIVQHLKDTATPDLDAKSSSTTSWDGNSRPTDYDFCFAWQSDPQYYVEKYKNQNIFETMNQWIVDNADEWKIKYVINTGDIIDDMDLTYQWELADKAMKIFDDAGMPYGVLAGNHDVGESLADSKLYCKYFGENRFRNQPTYGGSYKNNLGHYDLISQNGEDFIIVYMSWNIYEEEINWLNSILSKYSDRKALLCFHAYTQPRILKTASRTDYFGELLEKTVISTNPNVFAVLNGHYYGSAYYIKQFDDNDDGVNDRTVYHLSKDYQAGPNGGDGYVDMLYFDIDGGKIYQNSYSPIKDDFNFYDYDLAYESIKNTTGKTDSSYYNQANNCETVKELSISTPDADSDDYYNAFILNETFSPVESELLSGDMTAYVCKNELIGSGDVDANNVATVSLDSLTAENDYVWYATVNIPYTSNIKTAFFEFSTPYTVTFHSNLEGINENVFRTYYQNSYSLPTDENILKLTDSGAVASFYDIPELSDTDNNKYIFKGWYLDQDNDNDSSPIDWNSVYTESTDIYAHWIVIKDVYKENDGKITGSTSYSGFDLAGVQIRMATETKSSGLRFVTVLSEDVYSKINGLNEKNGNKAEYGCLMAKTSAADSSAKFYGGDYELKYNDTNVNGEDTTSQYSYVKNVVCSNSPDHFNGENYRLYTAVITYNNLNGDTLTNAHNTPFVVRSYIRYYDSNGLLRTCYNNYTGNTAKYNGCSVSYGQIAQLANSSGNIASVN